MKTLLFTAGWALVFALFQPSTGWGQNGSHRFYGKNFSAVYQTEDGRLHGTYLSRYANGKRKASGQFYRNARVGTWTTWDSTGTHKVERHYSDPFQYEARHPKPVEAGPLAILSAPVYYPNYNEQGFREFMELHERMVIWLKRIWSVARPETNPALFDPAFYQHLHLAAQKGEVKMYSPKDDFFTTQFSLEELPADSLPLVAWKIKEEWFFDNERFIMEARIIGLCAVTEVAGKPVEIGWFYYPEIRPVLAQLPLKQTSAKWEVRSYDDLFFFRDFSFEITKESNYQDRVIADYQPDRKGQLEEAKRIWLGLYEQEHKMWLEYTPRNN